MLKKGGIIFSVVLGALISALGFGCKSHKEDIECVYGPPPVEYEDTLDASNEPEPADKI